MSLDARYFIAPSLEECFIDKDTGAPLAAGVVYFWEDEARTIPKPVYKLSGSPPNYSFVELENPATLSSIGTPQDPDNGDNILWYYKPYDPDTGEVQLYYIEVYSAGGKTSGVLQFTREAWPNISAAGSATNDITNYVPNGQFLLHNDILATSTSDAGEITEPVTILAQGGWTFDRPSGSAARDIVTFEAIGATDNPTGNPKFAVRVECESPSAGDTYKDLRLEFQDVNKFASTTQQYTFGFSAQANSSQINVQLVLIKNYGTGGSATTETVLATLTVGSSYDFAQATFSFGTNTSKTIADDSYLQLAVRFPTNLLFDVELTDFVLTPNAVTITNFPATTDAEFKSQSIAGWVDKPAYDGSQLFLKPVLTQYGMAWDDSEIGDVVQETQTSLYDGTTGLHTDTNRMLAMGVKYIYTDYSPLGIPYARLADKYWISAANIYRYGTGADYVSCAFSGTGNQLIVSNNSAGAVTDTADVSTTFTISNVHQGDTGYFCKAYLTAASTFYLANNTAGVVTAITANTSGFTVVVVQTGSAILPQISSVQTIAASGMAGGQYFTFYTYNGSAQHYYCWFKLDGAGADPAPGGTGILVDLLSTDTAEEVAQKVRTALNGFEVTSIRTVAGNVVPASSYFTFSATGDNYYLWYRVDGAGTDPAISNRIGIRVDVASTDTNTQVATKTQQAMNRYSFASPDLRGLFLRATNAGATVDPGVRWSMVPGIIGTDTLGTFELSDNLSHQHGYTRSIEEGLGYVAGNDFPTLNDDDELTTASGTSEARPYNANVTTAIKY